MTAVDDILSRIPLTDLAARLGVDEGTAEQATRAALPALLGGIQANAADPRGAASFAEAVGQHDNDLAEGGVNGAVDLNGVDENDGDRIVGHVFGEQRGDVVQQLGGLGGLGGTGGGGQDLIGRLLPILAPIVMAYLARRLTGAAAGQQAGTSGQGGLGDLLGSILGGGAGGGLGGLGGAIGGGSGGFGQQGGPQQGGFPGGLGDLLGGLLGGGRRA